MGTLIKNIFLAIPFYFLWNFLAPIYLFDLPQAYKDVPFWHIVGIFLLISILRLAIFPKGRGQSSFQWKAFDFNPARPIKPDVSDDDSFIKDVTPNRPK